eukprot:scaffold725_cov133-Cylindrotheca_fusiformis.AAC.12
MLSSAIRLELGLINKVTIDGLLKRSKILLVLDIVRLLMMMMMPLMVIIADDFVDTPSTTAFHDASKAKGTIGLLFIGWMILLSICSIGMEIRILQHSIHTNQSMQLSKIRLTE